MLPPRPVSQPIAPVSIPAARTLKVYRRAHQDYPEVELLAPFSENPETSGVFRKPAANEPARGTIPARKRA